MTDEAQAPLHVVPRTPLGWAGALLGIAYFALGFGFSRGALPDSGGLLPWVVTFVLGSAALALCYRAWQAGERAIVLIVCGALALFWYLQYVILLVAGFLTGGLFSGGG